MNPYKKYCSDIHNKVRNILLMTNLESRRVFKLETNQRKFESGRIISHFSNTRKKYDLDYNVVGYKRVEVLLRDSKHLNELRGKGYDLEYMDGINLSLEEFYQMLLDITFDV